MYQNAIPVLKLNDEKLINFDKKCTNLNFDLSDLNLHLSNDIGVFTGARDGFNNKFLDKLQKFYWLIN